MAHDILEKIVAYKQKVVAADQQQLSLAALKQTDLSVLKPRDFVGALKQKIAHQQPAIIAEIKKASPSKGVLRTDFDPSAIAQSYAMAGAACLSVLTDIQFFQGSNEYLQAARAACELPVLRKDFMIDNYQIYQARYLGADCILLIVAILSDAQLQAFTDLALELNMAVLVEIHDAAELERALKLNTPLIGINNRNLRNFVTDLNTSLELVNLIPTDKIVIAESGIHKATDIALLQEHKIHSFLIGEAFMREVDPGMALKNLAQL